MYMNYKSPQQRNVMLFIYMNTVNMLFITYGHKMYEFDT